MDAVVDIGMDPKTKRVVGGVVTGLGMVLSAVLGSTWEPIGQVVRAVGSWLGLF